jgi:hypothetical protein
VTTKTADMHCASSVQNCSLSLSSETSQYPLPGAVGHPQFEIRTVSKSEQRAAVGCGRLQWKPQPFCGFPQDPDGLSAPPPRWGRFFLIFDDLVNAVEQRVWKGKHLVPHHICKPASCARRNVDRLCRLALRNFLLGSVRHGQGSNCRFGKGFRR